MTNTMIRPAYGFRKNLKIYRNAQGLTSRELSERCGISHTAILRYENGTRSPSPATLAALAKVLEISLDDLFAGE